MVSRRVLIAIAIYIVLCASHDFLQAGVNPPMGILTRAYGAQLNSAEAYPGLSVFEGESLSTATDGKLGVRIGTATLALSQGAQATLQRMENGTHVDMAGGVLFFASPENSLIEVHIADALLRPENGQSTQAEVRMMGPKVLQVAAMRGNLEFNYRNEFQLIPEGETYRIYLDAPAEPQKPAGVGAASAGTKHKTVIYIVAGAVAAGGAAWGIHELIESSNGPESPAKP
jgi:hypothetical protein